MDTKQFIVEIVKAISWPLGLLLALLIFRRQIVGIFTYLKRVKIGDNEFEFENRVNEIDIKTASVKWKSKLTKKKNNEAALSEYERYINLAESQPTAAIMDVWRSIEGELYRIAKPLLPQRRAIPAGIAIDVLSEDNQIDDDAKEILTQLRIARNEVAHPWSRLKVSSPQAITYVQSALKMTQYLKQK